ncbi:MAG: hypothetical protein MJ014_02185 [Methanocorpusculum sp.]|nr:hypothetical protein [Methanocorpusculum sp.]
MTFTLMTNSGYALDTLTDNGVTETVLGTSYILPDVDQPHEIVATITSSPVPPIPPSIR